MELIYAIYKENIIPLVGGVNPNNIEIGLADYNNWKLCAMSAEEFTKFSEFKLYPIPKSIAIGLTLINKTEIKIPEGNVPVGNIPTHVVLPTGVLSEEEIELSKLAKKYVDKLDLKFVTRAKIREFKDFEDDLADTKLLVEFLLGYIAEDFSSKSDEEKSVFPIKEQLNTFVDVLNAKDLRINNPIMLSKVSKVIKDEAFISKIVKSNYVDKIKQLN